jgi:hypothetical protein
MDLTIDGLPADEYKSITPEARERIGKIKNLPDGELRTKEGMAELLEMTPTAVISFTKYNRKHLDAYLFQYKQNILYGNEKTIAEAKEKLK